MDFKLRKWEEKDAISMVTYANNPNVSAYLTGFFPYPYTLTDAQKWVDVTKEFDQDTIVYCIDIDNEAVGGITLQKGKDVHSPTATLGYWLGEPFWGKGIISRAIKEICDEGFQKLDIVRIQAEVFSPNIPSQKVLLKNGFALEATLKNAVMKNNELSDELIFVKFSSSE